MSRSSATLTTPLWLGWSAAFARPAHMLLTALALSALLSPVLLMQAIQGRFVHEIRAQLEGRPDVLEIRLFTNASLDSQWFDEVAHLPEIGFLIPALRNFGTTLTVLSESGARVDDVRIIPTAAGDPLIGPQGSRSPAPGEVIVTHTLGQKLDGADGTTLTAEVRRFGSTEATWRIPLEVLRVLPMEALPGDAVLLQGDLALAIEDFLDGLWHPQLNGNARNDQASKRSAYAGARIYARNLDSVPPLAAYLGSRGLPVRSQADSIQEMRELVETQALIVELVLAVSAAAALGVASASNAAMLAREKPGFALLILGGADPWRLALMPMVFFGLQLILVTSFSLILMTAGALAIPPLQVNGVDLPVEITLADIPRALTVIVALLALGVLFAGGTLRGCLLQDPAGAIRKEYS